MNSPANDTDQVKSDLFQQAFTNLGFKNQDEFTQACKRVPSPPDMATYAENYDDPASAPLK